MEDRREFNDILIDERAQDQNRSKKIILLVVAAVLLFAILVIAVIASLNEDKVQKGLEQSTAAQGGLQKDPVAFADKPVSTPTQENPDEFEPIKPQSTTDEDDRFGQIVQQIQRRQSEQNPTLAQNTEPTQTPQVLPTPAPVQPEPTQAPAPKPTPQTQTTQLRQTQATPAPKPVVTSKPVAQPARPGQDTAQNMPGIAQTFPSQTIDKSKNGQNAQKGHYIQVGSFSNTPNKEFLSKLENYSYRVYNMQNATKYLIGPYNSRTDANRDMLKVKTDMGEQVFYYEVK
ncbi:SPOR domain-containing protein [Helicobacter himalayensis]|uniref:SPOR domain-containing protein n=1 Tax=Helicobacter himalayensis TaxID=1591088 RepID=UPI003D6F7B85